MASKSSKLTSEQKVKRALAQLDSAVQVWYAEHNPENKDHYALAHICDYGKDYHASRITLHEDREGNHYTDICSLKHSKGGH